MNLSSSPLTRAILVIQAASLICEGAEIPAFPGAEGFGANTAGGRGGDVYVVDTLESSGPGSFYRGVTTIPSSGRTIVFAVSGEIHLAGGIKTRITGNKLTIAGQTAPGGGILLRDGTLRISGDDIVIRHLRFRHGKNGSGGDCIDLDSNCENAILDHVSMAFGTDENISSFKRPPENLTMQWSLNAWGLESHSCGGLWDQNHATCHHSLWAHNHTRNPKARPGGLLEWTNNVTFDWDIGFIMGDSDTPAAWKANVIGNYFICPPGNIRKTPLEKARLSRDGRPNFSVHVSNNLHDMDSDQRLNGIDRGWDIVGGTPFDESKNPKGNYVRLDKPVSGSGALAIDDPLTGYKKVVSQAGALRLDAGFTEGLRDEVDARLIENVTDLKRNHITRESELKGVSNDGFGKFSPSKALPDGDEDGMPDVWEAALRRNPRSKDHNEEVRGASFFPEGTPAGYTALEEYLYFKSVPHLFVATGTVTRPEIDLSRYTDGFKNSPKFTISNVTGGTAIQGGAGGKLVRFTAGKASGRGGFHFTVTDADGSTWTQQFAICVTGS
jgi:pectate lyase